MFCEKRVRVSRLACKCERERLNFNPTNVVFRKEQVRRHELRAVYTIQNTVFSQSIGEGRVFLKQINIGIECTESSIR